MALTKDSFTLMLAGWQVRMAKDFLPSKVRKFTRIIIVPGVIKCPMSYKIPPEGITKRDWVLYLTDEQILIVQEKLNLKTPVVSININEKLIVDGNVRFA